MAVDAALNDIAADPERFARIDSRHRGCMVKRYPFRIVYRIEPTYAENSRVLAEGFLLLLLSAMIL